MRIYCSDIETTGLQFGVDKITSVAVQFKTDFLLYAPIAGESVDSFHCRICNFISVQLESLIDTDYIVVGHNIKFDLRMLEIPPDLIDELHIVDTTYLYHYLYAREEKALGSIEFALYGTNVKEQYITEYGKDFSSWPTKILHAYNRNDVELTTRIFRDLYQQVPSDFNQYMERLLKAIYRIEYSGFPFDGAKAETVRREFELHKGDKLEQIYGCLRSYKVDLGLIDLINFNSSKQLSNLIYNVLGCRKPDRNEFPRGKAYDKLFTATMTNASLLKRLNHPFVTLYLELAAIESTLTFIKTYTGLSVGNRLYPSFNITGTITGRLSCSKPNLQNIKKKSVDKFTPRSLFVPEIGETLVSIDYQQQEIRMLAVLSQDKHLLELVGQGIDMHYAVGCKMMGKDSLTKEERDTFKSLHFALLYGVSPSSLAFTMNRDESEVIELIEDYYIQFPDVKDWMQQITNETLINRELTFWSNRKWYAMPYDNMAYQGINAMIQGSSADFTNLAAIRLSSFLRNSGAGRILSIIHDEFLFSLKDTSVIPKLVKIMENEKLFGVPFLTDVEIAETY